MSMERTAGHVSSAYIIDKAPAVDVTAGALEDRGR